MVFDQNIGCRDNFGDKILNLFKEKLLDQHSVTIRAVLNEKKKNPVLSPNVGKRRPARVIAGNFLAGDS